MKVDNDVGRGCTKEREYSAEIYWPDTSHTLLDRWRGAGATMCGNCGKSPPLNEKWSMQASLWWITKRLIIGEDMEII